jgi:hypothetical protein
MAHRRQLGLLEQMKRQPQRPPAEIGDTIMGKSKRNSIIVDYWEL